MKCSNCPGYSLVPAELEPGLVAANCPRCNGWSIPLMNFRYWFENLYEPTSKPVETIENISDSAKVVSCCKCDRLMSKFKISNSSSNRLDFCNSCDEVWLDEGEWEHIKAEGLLENFTTIPTEVWQAKLRREFQEESLNKRYEEKLGSVDFARAKELKDWVNGHPMKKTIRQFLIV